MRRIFLLAATFFVLAAPAQAHLTEGLLQRTFEVNVNSVNILRF